MQSGQSMMADHIQNANPDAHPDLYDVLHALGGHAINSTWFGSNIDCYGKSAVELYALTNEHKPMTGDDLLHLTLGIQQTMAGDFIVFDPDTTSYWIFIRAWDGTGFYLETSDLQSMKQLRRLFPTAEEMEGVAPPYKGLFIYI